MDDDDMKVFSSDELPEKRLQARQRISLDERITDIGYAIHRAKKDMVYALAQKMMDDEKFFQSYVDETEGFKMLEYNVDCVVLTQEEYFKMKQESFNDGLRHATGYVSYEVDKVEVKEDSDDKTTA